MVEATAVMRNETAGNAAAGERKATDGGSERDDDEDDEDEDEEWPAARRTQMTDGRRRVGQMRGVCRGRRATDMRRRTDRGGDSDGQRNERRRMDRHGH